jgi:hypothetical protein
MLLQKYDEFIPIINPDATVEEKIVFSIISDLSDRRGLKQEWDNI